MHKHPDVTNPPTSAREAQDAAEQESKFRVIRATAAVPGPLTWREKRARTDRTPFRAEIEIARAVMDRAIWTGDRAIVEQASGELYDLALTFVKFVGVLIQDGRTRVARFDSDRAA